MGVGKPGDVDAHTRVRCYQAILPSYPPGTAMLSLLPLAMRMGGPREALWHAIIRKNYGATHFIVGRDHAGPGIDSHGKPFYRPYEAQQLLDAHAGEIGLQIMPFRKMVYVPDRDTYSPEDEVPPGSRCARSRAPSSGNFSTKDASYQRGSPRPPWRRNFRTVTRRAPSVASPSSSPVCPVQASPRSLPPSPRHSASVSGAAVTLLDGDIVRQNLSSDLGFSRAERDRNVLRIGYVAAEITAHRGIAICAPIAPYDAARREVKRMIESGGGFVMVYVATPLGVCESRDRKGHYARARAGLMPHFTGVSDPYEVPTDADIVIDTDTQSVEDVTRMIIGRLEQLGYLAPQPVLTAQADCAG